VVSISRIDAKSEISPFVAVVVIIVVLAVAASVALYPLYSRHITRAQPNIPPGGTVHPPIPPMPDGGAPAVPAQPAQPGGGVPPAPSPGKG